MPKYRHSAARLTRTQRPLHLEGLEPRQLLAAEPIISEFMASNQETLEDGDGNLSDWIEIYNAGDQAVDLDGYHLTDDAEDKAKWTFPATNLDAGQHLVVFASGQSDNRGVDATGHLHTNFKLDASGEYLALVSPTGNVLSQFGSAQQDYPPQSPDVSFGRLQARILVSPESQADWWVPLDNHLGTRWTEVDFDAQANAFTRATAAVGYEDRPNDRTNFQGQFNTELGSETHAVFTRMEFSIEDPMQVTALKLNLKYDNGFVAYLNGVRVAAENAPDNLGWFSAAPDGSRRDSLAIQFSQFDLSEYVDRLVPGKNVLAIHGLNNLLRDRSDFLLVPQLFAGVVGQQLPVGFLPTPTPGQANISPAAMAGPLITQVTENPGALGDQQDLLVTARLAELNAPIDSASLIYRVMYGPEVSLPMVDDGTGGDELAGDGVFTALIPHAASDPGQMVRWAVTTRDVDGRTGRAPNRLDQSGRSQSPQYFGTVVADPAINTQLPVMQWFVESPRSADTDRGTRASLWWGGEFYDNVFVRIRGGTARSWPKKSYKVEMNDGHHFRLRDDLPRVDEINLNATYTDKSYVRAVLTSEFQNDAGTPSPDSFLVRVQQNGQFYSVAIVVEQPDRDFLRRHGLDDQGSLYKGGPGSNLQSLSGLEKKTRPNEDRSDLQSLVNGLKQRGDDLERFLFDQVDIPAVVNFMATNVITQNIDASDKNYYLYRDTEGTGQWQLLPWDLDLTFGPDALNTDTILADESRRGARNPNAVHPFLGSRRFTLDSAGKFNELQDRIVENPRTREMLLRRIRSLADQFLATTYFQDRMDQLVAQIAPDVELDKQRWGANAHFGSRDYTLLDAIDRIKNEYLARRLPYLTTRQGELTERQGGVGIPPSQMDDPPIVFGAIELDPASGNQDEEYIELVNTNPFSVDLSGWQLTGGVQFTFHPGTVIPAGQSLYVSPDLAAFRARSEGPRAGQGLLVQGDYDGHLSRDGELLSLATADGQIVQRALVGGETSVAQKWLRITEINFHPHAPNLVPGLGELDDGSTEAADRFEFIELANIGDQVLDVSGAHISQSVDFTFPAGTVLQPGQRTVVAADQAAFQSRYGTRWNVAGQFSGSLADDGGRIFLDDTDGRVIHTFAYGSEQPWPGRANGRGSSLIVVDTEGDYNDPANWRASTQFGGSPGELPPDDNGRVTINEVLANTESVEADMIELHNTSGTPVDISNWYLSNRDDNYFAFRIPAPTIVAPLGFAVFDQSQFGFGFDSAGGDDVWLVAADGNGKPLRFVDHAQFGPSEAGVSLGPLPAGEGQWVQLAEPTWGQPNAGPWVGPIVISQLHYSPVDPDREKPQVADDFEFIELTNRSDTVRDISGWRISGATQMTIPDGTMIGPGQSLTLVGFDPSNVRQASIFRFTLGMPMAAPIAGPFSPPLDNTAGAIQLGRPVLPPPDAPDLVVWVPIDDVMYRSSSPWPDDANGTGKSLVRTEPDAYGNLPTSWVADTASPGTAVFAGARQPGDANGDGQFDSTDLTLALQAGKYQTDQPAVWSEGDWTGDGRFDQLDIVFALQQRG